MENGKIVCSSIALMGGVVNLQVIVKGIFFLIKKIFEQENGLEMKGLGQTVVRLKE